MTGGIMDYRLGDIETTNAAVRTRLGEFSTTLKDFDTTVKTLFTSWGGAAAAASNDVSLRLQKQGEDIRLLVENYLKALETNLDESRRTEQQNIDLFRR